MTEFLMIILLSFIRFVNCPKNWEQLVIQFKALSAQFSGPAPLIININKIKGTQVSMG
jgi:hypothetical protein